MRYRTETDVIPTALLIAHLRRKQERPEPKIRVKEPTGPIYFFSGFRQAWTRLTSPQEPRGSRAQVEVG